MTVAKTTVKNSPDVPRGMRFCPICDVCRLQAEFYLSSFCSGELFPICERHLSEKEAEAREKNARAALARAGIRPRSPLVGRASNLPW